MKPKQLCNGACVLPVNCSFVWLASGIFFAGLGVGLFVLAAIMAQRAHAPMKGFEWIAPFCIVVSWPAFFLLPRDSSAVMELPDNYSILTNQRACVFGVILFLHIVAIIVSLIEVPIQWLGVEFVATINPAKQHAVGFVLWVQIAVLCFATFNFWQFVETKYLETRSILEDTTQ